jgi:hypothetical protein
VALFLVVVFSKENFVTARVLKTFWKHVLYARSRKTVIRFAFSILYLAMLQAPEARPQGSPRRSEAEPWVGATKKWSARGAAREAFITNDRRGLPYFARAESVRIRTGRDRGRDR